MQVMHGQSTKKYFKKYFSDFQLTAQRNPLTQYSFQMTQKSDKVNDLTIFIILHNFCMSGLGGRGFDFESF